jgi:hypothetical protein
MILSVTENASKIPNLQLLQSKMVIIRRMWLNVESISKPTRIDIIQALSFKGAAPRFF